MEVTFVILRTIHPARRFRVGNHTIANTLFVQGDTVGESDRFDRVTAVFVQLAHKSQRLAVRQRDDQVVTAARESDLV